MLAMRATIERRARGRSQRGPTMGAEARHALVRFGARLFAVVAARAERGIDEQNVGRFRHSLLRVVDHAGIPQHHRNGRRARPRLGRH